MPYSRLHVLIFTIMFDMHKIQVEGLKAVLNKQQEEHLAVIRKMKLEQNQVLLKCHELEQSLRT